MGKRDQRIDVLKGIGIICVIWAHLRGYLDIEIYIFHMPLFFFLSGMFYKRKKRFILSRFKSLVIPYATYTALFIGLFFLQGGNWMKPIHRLSIWFPSAVVGPAWFLIALFNISAIYYLLERFVKRTWLRFTIVFAIALCFYYIKVDLPFDLRQSFYALPFYAIGHYMKERGLTDFTNKKYAIAIAMGIFAITVAYCRIEHFRFDILCGYLPKNPLLFYGGALSAIFLLLNVRYFAKPSRINSVISSFGRHSLAIMALHMPYMFFLRRHIFHMHLHHDPTWNNIITFFVTFIIITLASYLLSVAIDHSVKKIRTKLTKESSRFQLWLFPTRHSIPKE